MLVLARDLVSDQATFKARGKGSLSAPTLKYSSSYARTCFALQLVLERKHRRPICDCI
jgi:hypothetical protein